MLPIAEILSRVLFHHLLGWRIILPQFSENSVPLIRPSLRKQKNVSVGNLFFNRRIMSEVHVYELSICWIKNSALAICPQLQSICTIPKPQAHNETNEQFNATPTFNLALTYFFCENSAIFLSYWNEMDNAIIIIINKKKLFGLIWSRSFIEGKVILPTNDQWK